MTALPLNNCTAWVCLLCQVVVQDRFQILKLGITTADLSFLEIETLTVGEGSIHLGKGAGV